MSNSKDPGFLHEMELCWEKLTQFRSATVQLLRDLELSQKVAEDYGQAMKRQVGIRQHCLEAWGQSLKRLTELLKQEGFETDVSQVFISLRQVAGGFQHGERLLHLLDQLTTLYQEVKVLDQELLSGVNSDLMQIRKQAKVTTSTRKMIRAYDQSITQPLTDAGLFERRK